ncbi:MAG TPA: sigma-E factor negative regulatory protein [Gammaproteobacteria bacterium]|nr:sigma-E factor negative regulatory protein [Gammaproteobacteria bacterium]
MTQKLREQISALADQALPEGEHELLLRRFAVEKSLRLHWERYHLIGEAMRKGLPPVDTRGFADRVMTAISQESQPEQKSAGLGDRFMRGLAGVAVAATVAVVAITGLRYDTRRAGVGPSEIVPTGMARSEPLPIDTALMNTDWSGDGQPSQAALLSTPLDQEDVNTSQTPGGRRAYYNVPRQDDSASDSGKSTRKKHKTPRQP